MALITIDGHIGAGEAQLGRRVARMLDFQYVDRLFLPGSHVITTIKERKPRFSERFWSTVEKAVRGMALGNAAGDPYFADPDMALMPLTWDHSPGAPMLKEKADISRRSLAEITSRGRAVIVQRAGAVSLKGHNQVVRIGLFASWEDRVKRLMSDEGMVSVSDAEKALRRRQEAQARYFGSEYGAHPEDESLYDLCVNTSREQINVAALKTTRAAQQMLAATA